MPVLVIVPAYQAERSVARVVRGLRAELGDEARVIVVDDGSTDRTRAEAEAAGALVVAHDVNRGKGAALRSGFARALELGADSAVTVDADGQHPPEEAARLARHPAARSALVLGVRNLARDGAPKANRFSNGFSNRFLSWFGGRKLADTQCGLRRYPLPEVSSLGARSPGYAFEAETVLRAARRGFEIVEVPVRVIYPPPSERVSHFDAVRDPARIVYRVLESTLLVPRRGARRRVVVALAAALVGLVLAHVAIGVAARPARPDVHAAEVPLAVAPGFRSLGRSYVLERGALLEVGLFGDPVSIGSAHSRLLRDAMLENEGALLRRFDEAVPSVLARTLLVDLAKLRYRDVDRGFSEDRRREIAAGALAFAPDPYATVLPTYQRFLYLNALYDISLSFEHSPLVGCTTVAFHGAAEPEGGALLARAFDMEAGPEFDRHKAVFLVHEDGKIPFASVAWPGLVGVVSGMNREGLAVVVHGARAGDTLTVGEPVVHALRRVLSEGRTVADAVRLLGERTPLVSHIVIAADADGNVAAIERVPGAPPSVRALPERAAVTNHLEGPWRDDPKNQRVLRESTTLARRARADELVARAPEPVDARAAVAMLRDRRGPGDAPLPLGDRRAIDALIATHGVVFDTRTKTLWVSEAPHLLGRFVAFDLARMLADDYRPNHAPLPFVPAEPMPTE
ncbi:MAG TPA: C45 family autoproteolytic acyltransferase/hydrolase [Polyangiaceae bacterium]|nr:C45 family autoproteolytic acyltransferase/hydrolase [Polyangiaceae bacterium]